MTKRELLEQQIKTEKQWLDILLNKNYADDELGLPKHLTRKRAIDEALDQLIQLRNQTKSLKDD